MRMNQIFLPLIAFSVVFFFFLLPFLHASTDNLQIQAQFEYDGDFRGLDSAGSGQETEDGSSGGSAHFADNLGYDYGGFPKIGYQYKTGDSEQGGEDYGVDLKWSFNQDSAWQLSLNPKISYEVPWKIGFGYRYDDEEEGEEGEFPTFYTPGLTYDYQPPETGVRQSGCDGGNFWSWLLFGCEGCDGGGCRLQDDRGKIEDFRIRVNWIHGGYEDERFPTYDDTRSANPFDSLELSCEGFDQSFDSGYRFNYTNLYGESQNFRTGPLTSSGLSGWSAAGGISVLRDFYPSSGITLSYKYSDYQGNPETDIPDNTEPFVQINPSF